MQNDWILDVLSDLKSFAVANGMGVLAEQLDDTRLVAAAEIASHAREAERHRHDEQSAARSDIGDVGRHQRA